MPYIGKAPIIGGFHKLGYPAASATDTYALTLNGASYFPETANQLLVSLNGVIQAPQDSFTISGSNLVFAEALTASDSIDFVVALGDVLAVGSVTDGSVTTAKIGNNAVTKAKIGTTELDLVTIKDSTGTNTAMTIDSSGRVITPARPAFHVTRSANITLTGGNDHQIFPFDTVTFDIGNNFSTTNFNYVCPVAGVYFFSLNARIDVATQGGSQYLRGVIYKGADAATNIGPYQVAGASLHAITGENASDFESMVVSGVLQCNAGDIVTAMGGHNTDTSIQLHTQSQFTGFLVG
tara:strand:+ start:763 stop:1644 length:882 start_codon:yes stop_codon:yes gene_type:complete